jgi:hypothetical protein
MLLPASGDSAPPFENGYDQAIPYCPGGIRMVEGEQEQYRNLPFNVRIGEKI